MTNEEYIRKYTPYELLVKMQENFENSYPGCILDTAAGKTVICRKFPADHGERIVYCRNCIKMWLGEKSEM